MSAMSEAWAEQQELEAMQEQQLAACEEHWAILDALQTAKNLGLETEKVKVLCYSAGVSFDDLF
jgi:hypothetical protein